MKSLASSRSFYRQPIVLYEIGSLLSDHNYRRVRVSATNGRHDRRVDHPQPFDSVYLQPKIDDGGGIGGRAHLRCSDRMINGHRNMSNVTLPVRVRSKFQVFAPRQFDPVNSRSKLLKNLRLANSDRDFRTFDQSGDVHRIGEIISVDERAMKRIGTT